MVALGGLAWASHHGAAKQAQKDAPVTAQAQGQAVYSNATAALGEKQLDNTTTRAAQEAHVRETTDGHIQRVETAADARAAFGEFLSGLHDGEPQPAGPKGAPLPGGPGAADKAGPPR